MYHMDAVVDKWGFLWTGSGAFQYGDTGTYSVLRFDTSIDVVNDAAKPILAFSMPDEANVRTGWRRTHRQRASPPVVASCCDSLCFS